MKVHYKIVDKKSDLIAQCVKTLVVKYLQQNKLTSRKTGGELTNILTMLTSNQFNIDKIYVIGPWINDKNPSSHWQALNLW